MQRDTAIVAPMGFFDSGARAGRLQETGSQMWPRRPTLEYWGCMREAEGLMSVSPLTLKAWTGPSWAARRAF